MVKPVRFIRAGLRVIRSRRFVRAAAIAFVVLGVSGAAFYAHATAFPANETSDSGNQLCIPPLEQGQLVDGVRKFRLVVEASEKQFFPGQVTRTAGINGPYLGPTLRMKQGEHVALTVVNRLDEKTTMHWHGMHVPARMDGTPHQEIEPGTSWTASFPVHQRAATLWYHPHPHGNTGPQVYRGLAGQLWIDDQNTESLSLPNTYGVDDIPLTIQDRNFTRNNQFRVPGGVGLGQHILINGTLNPVVQVGHQQVRFRLLNGSNGRIYYIGFDDNRQFLQIGTDGGLLEKPVATNRVVLAPGERAEIVADFSDGKDVVLKSFPEAGLLQTAQMVFNLQGSGNLNLLKIQPRGKKAAAKKPKQISTDTRLSSIKRYKEDDAAVTRSIALGGRGGRANGGNGTNRGGNVLPGWLTGGRDLTSSSEQADQDSDRTGGAQRGARGGGGRGGRAGFAINGASMDMHIVNERVRLGDTEIWELTNGTGAAHPFHVHLVQFQVLTRNGKSPSGTDLGWKDTILVHPGDRIRVIMKFDRYADPQTPYMYHCHIMAHEDNGMMGQFLVVNEPKEFELVRNKPSVVVFIAGQKCAHCVQQIRLFDKMLRKEGINMVVVAPDNELDSQLVQSLRCPIVSDPTSNWAGWFQMLHDGPAHGILLVNANGEVVWSNTDDAPYMDADALVNRYKSSIEL